MKLVRGGRLTSVVQIQGEDENSPSRQEWRHRKQGRNDAEPGTRLPLGCLVGGEKEQMDSPRMIIRGQDEPCDQLNAPRLPERFLHLVIKHLDKEIELRVRMELCSLPPETLKA